MERAALTERIAAGFRGAIAATAALLLPPACVACERPLDSGEGPAVCGRCWARIPVMPHPRCDRCGHPVGEFRCYWCDLLPPYIRAARSLTWADEGVALDIVGALKYAGWERTALGMGQRMSRLPWPRDVLEERTALVPVPLARVRERERGFNQSALLASAIAPRWSIPVWPDSLVRTRATPSQTRLTPADRLRNVAGAFSVPPAAREVLVGAHVILVDDVVTTAATLNACAAALMAGGARIVSYVTFARARTERDRR